MKWMEVELRSGQLHIGLCSKGDGWARHINLQVNNTEQVFKATGLKEITKELSIETFHCLSHGEEIPTDQIHTHS